MLQPAGYRPAQAFVRAGVRTGNAEFGIRNLGTGMSVSGDCGFGGAVCLGVCPALRLWRGVLPWFAFGLCVPVVALPSVRARHRVPVAALPSRAPGIAFLSQLRPRFAFGLCVSVGALCLGSRSVFAFLSQLCPLDARLALRLWRGGYVRFAPAVCRTDGGIAFGVRLSSLFYCGVLPSVHACCLPCDKQDGLRYLAFLFRRVEIAIRAFSRRCSVICLCGFTSGLAVCLWRSRRGTRDGVTRRTGHGAGGAALVRLCASALALQVFPPGVRWGCAPQTCAKESSTLWTLFTLRRGCVGAYTHPYRKHQRPNQRTHACKTRVQTETRPALIYGRAGRVTARSPQHAPTSRLEPPPSGAESG